MARNAQWKRSASDTTSWRQDQALNSTAFIVKEIGPTGFLLKVEDENKPYKVLQSYTGITDKIFKFYVYIGVFLSSAVLPCLSAIYDF